MIKPVIKLIRALQSNAHPGEIALGVVLGLFWGLTPLNHTHTIFLVLAFFFLKINRAATLLVLPLVKLFYYLGLASAADGIGYFLLAEVSALKNLWIWFTHAPVLSLLSFEYTLVLGGYALAAILAAPVYILILKGVEAYRARFRDQLNNWQATKWLKGLTISKWVLSWWPR